MWFAAPSAVPGPASSVSALSGSGSRVSALGRASGSEELGDLLMLGGTEILIG